jgi:hypothetical protein
LASRRGLDVGDRSNVFHDLVRVPLKSLSMVLLTCLVKLASAASLMAFSCSNKALGLLRLVS